MRSKFWILFLFSLPLLVPASARAQYPWSGILNSSRATDWSHAGIPGGIPNYTTICATVSPSGQTDSTDMNNINAAIVTCAATAASTDVGQVVQLQAGTYTITGGLIFSAVNKVVLRGAGPDKTILDFAGSNACGGTHADICVAGGEGYLSNYDSYGGGATTWTGDNGVAGSYVKGDSVIDVGSWSGHTPQIGDMIDLDQRNDSIGICPPSGDTGDCSGLSGATESGTTVTIATSLPQGYSVGQCVGIGDVGTSGYNSISNTSGSCGAFNGWFQITAVWDTSTSSWNTTSGYSDPNSTRFQYTAPASGLASSGGGSVTADTGGIFISDVHGASVTEEATQGRTCPAPSNAADPDCAAGEISRRSQTEIKRITAINGNEITIDPPLELSNWGASQAPGVWWGGPSDNLDGVEDLTYDMTNDLTTTVGISFKNAYECWAKNVRGIDATRNHIWIHNSARIDVVDSYFFGTKASSTVSYGVEVFGGSDSLIQNNICQHITSCLMAGGSYGSVYGYNYEIDAVDVATNWLMGISEGHDIDAMNLFEGNDVTRINSDEIHGTNDLQTDFRNRIVGQDTPLKTNNLVPAQLNSFSRAFNFVGNVLGTTGAQTSYQVIGGTFPTSGTVWGFGTTGQTNFFTNDALVSSTVLRWGNYDVASGAVRWCGNSSDPGWTTTCNSTSEIPTTGVAYVNGNPVPSSTTLPASFYLSAQPAWWQTAWGTPPWPAIGPGITCSSAASQDCTTPADGITGYSYYIPAQLCYQNTPVDPNYQKSFTVTGATVSSGTGGFNYDVTLTVGTNSLSASDAVSVSGISPAGYDGTYQLLSATSTTITYGVQSNPGPYSSGGDVGWPNILLYNAANCYPSVYSRPSPVTVTATPH